MSAISKKTSGLNGVFPVAGDKSISHRALMFGALANGTTRITGLLEGEDVLRTAEAMRALGADIVKNDDGSWTVKGTPDLIAPDRVLDMGNAGTGVRLLMGIVASHPFETKFTGDSSLCSRPMRRVTEPLSLTGAKFETTPDGTLPLTVTGCANPIPARYTLPVASAQVKSAVLLSGLNIDGTTEVVEPVRCRDHTERMLKAFGANIRRDGDTIILKGKAHLKACDISVPADISSAAFPIVAALITPDSDLLLENVGVNPLRTGVLEILTRMGANIRIINLRENAGEPVADLRIRSSRLHGVEAEAALAPLTIDEYPILAVAAAFADGKTVFHGLSELKVKESNRFDAILTGLKANKIACSGTNDTIEIEGKGKNACGGGRIEAKLDHRMAMSFLVMGMAAENPVVVDDISSIATSFPDFTTLMNKAGASIYDYRD